jgi:sodium-dependent dicarboxylate transporter 2/3/5
MDAPSTALQSGPVAGKPLPWGLYIGVAALLAVLALPTPEGLPLAGHRVLAILVFAIIMWISEAVSYETSAIIITSLMAVLIGTAPVVNAPDRCNG